MKILIFTSDIKNGGVAHATLNYLNIFNNFEKITSIDLAVIESNETISPLKKLQHCYVFNKGTGLEKRNIIEKLLRIVRSFIKFNGVVKSGNYDAIITLNLEPNFIALLSRYILKSNSNIITTDHTDLRSFFSTSNPIKKVFKSILAILYSEASISVGCSISVRESIVASYNRTFLQTTTIYNTIRSDIVRKNSTSNQKYLATTGRLDRLKGYKELIIALNEHLLRTGLVLKIVGDGPERKTLEKLIAELGLKSHVELLGFIPNPSEVISSAFAYISSSKQEGFGLTLLEAMKLEVPVISSDCSSGPREIISPKSNQSFRLTNTSELTQYGILIPSPINFESFKTELIKSLEILQSNELRMKLIQNGKIRVEDFSEVSIRRDWEKLFTQFQR